MTCFVTTSWDDGHPADLRVAELLARYRLPGTFYVPAAGQRTCMDASALRALSQAFDVGAHTLTHLRLTGMAETVARAEIRGSKQFIEQQTGKPCRVFAAPWGAFRRTHVRQAAEAGFAGFRTTELMNLGLPSIRQQMVLMPTTLQVYPHAWPAYLRNALRRGRPLNLLTYLLHEGARGLPAMVDSLLSAAIARGGVLHLWGHGWEIEECGQWKVLEEMLARVAERRHEVNLVSNSDLCEWVIRDGYSKRAVPRSQVS